MSARSISAKKVRAVLDARIAACDDAAALYARRGQENEAATERCARLELQFVRVTLFPLDGRTPTSAARDPSPHKGEAS